MKHYNGILILKASYSPRHEAYRTETCPFCGRVHTHAPHDGHRQSHCTTLRGKPVTAPDGTELKPADGYYLNRPEKRH